MNNINITNWQSEIMHDMLDVEDMRSQWLADNRCEWSHCKNMEDAHEIAEQRLLDDPLYFRVYEYRKCVTDTTAVPFADFLLDYFEETIDYDRCVIRDLTEDERESLLPFSIDAKYLNCNLKLGAV